MHSVDFNANYSSLLSRRFHYSLTATVTYNPQTSVPCIVAYIPLALILATPLTGFSLGGIGGDTFIMCTALFPAIDPILIIYGVRA